MHNFPKYTLVGKFIIFTIIIQFYNVFFVPGLMPKQRSFGRFLQKKRKNKFGDTSLPKTWKDFSSIPDQFLQTNDGEPFMILDKIIGNEGERVIGFVSPSLKHVMANSSSWSIDGTFDITKWTLFKQVCSLISYLFASSITSFFLVLGHRV